jgi:transcriptional regulator NrdR family protein
LLNLVVKRGGQDEKFDEKKLYASIYASLMTCHVIDKEAKLISDEITKLVKRWATKKSHISSHDVRTQAAQHLREYNNLAAYVYVHHRMLS